MFHAKTFKSEDQDKATETWNSKDLMQALEGAAASREKDGIIEITLYESVTEATEIMLTPLDTLVWDDDHKMFVGERYNVAVK